MRPRIFQVIDHTESGGAQLIVYNIIKALNDQYEFSVVVLGKEGYYTDLYRSLNIPYYCFPNNNGRWDPLTIFRLIILFRKERPEIIHAHLFKSNSIGIIAARLSNIMSIIHDHTGIFPHAIENYQNYFPNRLFRDIYINIFQIALNQCDKVFIPTIKMVESYMNYSSIDRNKISIIPGFIDIKDFQKSSKTNNKISLKDELDLSQDTRIVIMVGRLVPEKDWFSFLKVACEFQHFDRFPCVFLIVGSGPQEEQLRKWIHNQRMGNSYFLGFRNDIARLLNQSDVFLLTSKKEAFGTVLIEAMAAECPIIATCSEGPAEIIKDGHNGFLVNIGDVNAMTTQVKELLLNSDLRNKITKQALEDVYNLYDMDTVSRKIDRKYTNILGSKKFIESNTIEK